MWFQLMIKFSLSLAPAYSKIFSWIGLKQVSALVLFVYKYNKHKSTNTHTHIELLELSGENHVMKYI